MMCPACVGRRIRTGRACKAGLAYTNPVEQQHSLRRVMSMPHVDESRARKRKRQANVVSAIKGQRCIDHFFSPGTCSPAAGAQHTAASDENEDHEEPTLLRTGAGDTAPSIRGHGVQKQSVHHKQTDQEQVLHPWTSNANDQHRVTHEDPTHSLHDIKASLRRDSKSLPLKTQISGKRTEANGLVNNAPSAGPDADAQQRLYEALATFTSALTERQQFRE